jgi:hypothetical protein
MDTPEFRVGQRVYYHYYPSGGDQRWYGNVEEICEVFGMLAYSIRFDGIETPQKYSNAEYHMIHSDEPLEPSWEA